MSNAETAKTQPSHRIFSVSRPDEKKAQWTEIGAAWPHKDGKGLNLQFTARPLEGAAVVLRLAEKRKAEPKSGRK